MRGSMAMGYSTTMQTEHLVRTLIVAIAWLAVLGAYLFLLLTGDAEGVAARLEGMLAVLTPAMLDTLRVARRERRRPSPMGFIGMPVNRSRDPSDPPAPR